MNRFKKGNGFTLIELLVVIAIIGILASVILANLNSARQKGSDGAIKATLGGARAEAAIFYDANQVYTAICTDPAGITRLILGAAQKLNAAVSSVGDNTVAFAYDPAGLVAGSAVCHDADDAWAAIVSLKTPGNPDSGWCVDSTGIAREATSLDIDVTACP